MRPSGRSPDEMRAIRITRGFTRHAEGSVLVEFGDTRVLVTASVEDGVPSFMRGKGEGWVTAEYGMLPRATHTRSAREAARGKQSGRTLEIQRLIGRSLRAAVDQRALGERTVTLDCDVLQADGGTRTAAITGAFVALADAMDALVRRRAIARSPLHGQVAAVSVGIVGGSPVVDLDYAEDSDAETDMNVVMNNGGAFIEIQGTAEGHAFRRHELDRLLDLASVACQQLFAAQLAALQAPRDGASPGSRRVSDRLPARLVLATGNAGKLRELRAILAPWRVEVLPLSDFTGSAAEETGRTFVENAMLKARFAAQAAGLPAIADDSGLEVDALGGAPGIRSARYAGEGAGDAANNARLLRELEGVPDAGRGARYRCAMVFVRRAGRPGPGRVPGELGGAHREGAARRRRVRIRPALPRRGNRADGRRIRARSEEPREPPRQGAPRARCDARRRRRRSVTMLSAPPLALYVHLPWCVRKCPYCDFNSHAVPSAGVPEGRYLAALLEDLDLRRTRGCRARDRVGVLRRRDAEPVLGPRHRQPCSRGSRELLPVAGDVEVTLEANPGTVEHGAFAAYRDAGINRVSLGAQSFDDRCLEALGRIHASREIDAAVAELRAAGLENFNLDLMYGLPEQTLARSASATSARAIELGPAHISHYNLTLEPGTAFERRPPQLPDEESRSRCSRPARQRLAAAGFDQYEVSAYARPGRRCTHNLNYWEFGDYLGIGAGAHGKLTDSARGRVRRTERVRQPGQVHGRLTGGGSHRRGAHDPGPRPRRSSSA